MADHKVKLTQRNKCGIALKISTRTGDFSERILGTSLVEITSAVEKMVLPVDPNFEKATPLLYTN